MNSKYKSLFNLVDYEDNIEIDDIMIKVKEIAAINKVNFSQINTSSSVLNPITNIIDSCQKPLKSNEKIKTNCLNAINDSGLNVLSLYKTDDICCDAKFVTPTCKRPKLSENINKDNEKDIFNQNNLLKEKLITGRIICESNRLNIEAHEANINIYDFSPNKFGNSSMKSDLDVFSNILYSNKNIRASSSFDLSTVKSKAKPKLPGPVGSLHSKRGSLIISNNSKKDPAKDDIFLSSQIEIIKQNQLLTEVINTLDSKHQAFIRDTPLSDISKKAREKLLPNGKVLLVVAFVENLELHGYEATIVLRDQTGAMSGTLHRDLVHLLINKLHIGDIVIFKQVSVLRPFFGRNYYLNLTTKNLISVYQKSSSNGGLNKSDFGTLDGLYQDALSSVKTSSHIVGDINPIEKKLEKKNVSTTCHANWFVSAMTDNDDPFSDLIMGPQSIIEPGDVTDRRNSDKMPVNDLKSLFPKNEASTNECVFSQNSAFKLSENDDKNAYLDELLTDFLNDF